MPTLIGPVILNAVGDEYTQPVEIRGVLWEGASTAGDTCELRERASGRLLFAGRAVGAQTWQGVVLPLTAPSGFTLTQLSSGRVLVYVAEPDGG